MQARKKPIDKEIARQRRTELYDAVNRGELSLRDTVKGMRKISRLTQTEFAAHRGVSAKVIKEIERGIGNPTVNTLNRIGQFFGLEVAFVRSDKLNPPAGHPREAIAAEGGPETAAPEFGATPVNEARRLMQELEDIKKLVAPSDALRQTLNDMEADLHALRDARERLGQAPERPGLASAQAQTASPMSDVDAELRAVQEARRIIESVDQIQRQIQPPSEVKKWLADIDAAGKLLKPLAPYLALSVAAHTSQPKGKVR